MQEHALGVGEELMIGGGIRLTVLAVEAGEVLLGITFPESGDVGGPDAGDRPSSCTGDAPSDFLRSNPLVEQPSKKEWLDEALARPPFGAPHE
jgi:hypothetical protein